MGHGRIFFLDVLQSQGITALGKGITMTNTNNDTLLFKVLSTATGQGGVSPKESIWGDHAVVEYDGKIYDPSYGLEYGDVATALEEFVIASIESIGLYRDTLQGEDSQGYGWVYEVQITGVSNISGFANLYFQIN
ncbi:MAG: hypothetical protein LBE12_06905 [Planctomycetaceae bacterium]|nr:hypothetical protein [Planctomycetaceae bacterium]